MHYFVNSIPNLRNVLETLLPAHMCHTEYFLIHKITIDPIPLLHIELARLRCARLRCFRACSMWARLACAALTPALAREGPESIH